MKTLRSIAEEDILDEDDFEKRVLMFVDQVDGFAMPAIDDVVEKLKLNGLDLVDMEENSQDGAVGEVECDMGVVKFFHSSDVENTIAIGHLDERHRYIQGIVRLSVAETKKLALGLLVKAEQIEERSKKLGG